MKPLVMILSAAVVLVSGAETFNFNVDWKFRKLPTGIGRQEAPRFPSGVS